jgi:YHS domain-containing protein
MKPRLGTISPLFAGLPLFAGTLALLSPAPAQQAALKGFDPVALCKGKEEAGKADFATTRGDFTYWFATAENLATFTGEPQRYEIQLGGSCARMGPLAGGGNPDRWHVHKERIYVFASDQCREGFKKRHDAFLDVTEAKPAVAAAAATAVAELLARAAAGHGGKQRLQAWRSYRHERATKNGDTTEVFKLHALLTATVRIDTDYLQGEKAWRYARVVGPQPPFFLDLGKVREMSADAHTEMVRDLGHEPLLALRMALDGEAVVTAGGKRDANGVDVDELGVWQHGRTTWLGIDKDSRIRTARFRGRGPGLWYGAVELTFAGYQELEGVHVPTTVSGTFEGKAEPSFTETRTGVAIDGALAPELFTRPK